MHLVVVECSNYSNCCQLFSYVFISKKVLCMCVSNVLEKVLPTIVAKVVVDILFPYYCSYR